MFFNETNTNNEKNTVVVEGSRRKKNCLHLDIIFLIFILVLFFIDFYCHSAALIEVFWGPLVDPGPTLRTTALEVHSSPLKGLTAIFTLRHITQPVMFWELYRKGGESIVPQHCFTLSTCKTI